MTPVTCGASAIHVACPVALRIARAGWAGAGSPASRHKRDGALLGDLGSRARATGAAPTRHPSRGSLIVMACRGNSQQRARRRQGQPKAPESLNRPENSKDLTGEMVLPDRIELSRMQHFSLKNKGFSQQPLVRCVSAKVTVGKAVPLGGVGITLDGASVTLGAVARSRLNGTRGLPRPEAQPTFVSWRL